MRPIPILTTIMLAGLMLLPPAIAEETTYEYTAAPSAWVGERGFGIYPCPNGCDFDEDGENDYPLQHGPFSSPAHYTNVIVTVEDAVWGDDVGMFSCVYHPDGDDICVPDDSTGPACGAVPILGSPFGGEAQIYLVAILVEEDLTVCGATTGTLTVSSS